MTRLAMPRRPRRSAPRPIELPRPTGPHPVGRRTYRWVDRARVDPYARLRSGARAVPVVIWHPADGAAGEPAPYLPRGWGWRLHGALWGVRKGVATHAREDAPPPPGDDRYPVLLFSHAGWAPYFYGATLEELASHGYVVVAPLHTHEVIPTTELGGGRRRWFRSAAVAGALGVSKRPHAEDVSDRGAVVDRKAADLRFVLDQLAGLDRGIDPLAGRIDLGRVGAFGHSFGGGAALVAAQTDPRVKAGANLDGGLWRSAERVGVCRPFLLVFADHPEFIQPCEEAVQAKLFSSVEWCEQDRALHLAAWQGLVERARPGYSVQIRGAEHRTFMDWRVLPLRPWSIGRMGHASIDGTRMWEVTTRCLRALFDRHLKEVPAPTFEALAGEMDELVVAPPRVLFAPAPAPGPAPPGTPGAAPGAALDPSAATTSALSAPSTG